jgi:GT2 family glycosyltransferase
MALPARPEPAIRNLAAANLYIERLRFRLARAEALAREAGGREAGAAAELAAIQRSRCWRLTYPVRALLNRYAILRYLAAGALDISARAMPAAAGALAGWVSAVTRRVARPPKLPDVVPGSPAPRVSVIIPMHAKAVWTARCLVSIKAFPPQAPIEVIVADDASPPGTLRGFDTIARLRLLRSSVNRGFLLTCNEAAKAARGEFLLFLNNDTEVTEGWLDPLLAALEAWPGAGAAGAKLVFPDGSLQEAGGVLWADGSGANFGRGGDPGAPEYNYTREVDWCSGACLLVRAALWQRLGGFDPVFSPAYCEDSDFALRLRAIGFATIYVPESSVIHHEGVSHGTDPCRGGKSYQAVNQARLRVRWQDVLAAENFPPAPMHLRARDRARNRRLTLVVDHLVPEPDRDAGSRTMMAFLDALQDDGDVVKFWPHNRHRTKDYAAVLEARGIEVLYGARPFTDWMAENGEALDRVLVSRPAVGAAMLAEIRAGTRAPVVYYGHDLHHQRLRAQAEALRDDSFLADAELALLDERRCWIFADVVLYPSEAEAAEVRRLMPGCDARAVPPYAFADFVAGRAPPAAPDLLMVAGFAHPPNEAAAQWFVDDIFPLVQKEVPDARLTVAGSFPTDAVRALRSPSVVMAANPSDAELQRLYARSRVAVVPLRFGAGVKRKTVEAMREGLPLVSSPVGIQGLPDLPDLVPVHDEPGPFAASVIRLLRDNSLWRAQCAAQERYVRQRFSREALQAALLAAFG